jgi:integrase
VLPTRASQERYCATKAQAQDVEARLRQELKAAVEQAAQEGLSPATLRALLEYYVKDLERRRKGAETITCTVSTAKAVERVTPELLGVRVAALSDRDVFAFTRAGAQEGAKPATINRDLRTLRAALKNARPEYRFPGGAFFPSDDTRVRWLRPEEELLVLEPMPSPFREMAKLAALTLMRQGEIRTLRPEYVHLEQGLRRSFTVLPRSESTAAARRATSARSIGQRPQLGRHAGGSLPRRSRPAHRGETA